jgi:small GTP-binding protein
VWDTAGQEQYRAITQAFYRRARGALIVFDWSLQDSFSHLKDWFESLYAIHQKGTIPVVLVGNKDDLVKAVSNEGAEQFAEEQGVELISTSAKNGRGVNEAFMKLAELILDHIQPEFTPTLEPTLEPTSCTESRCWRWIRGLLA